MLQCLRGFAFCVLTAVASSAHAGPQDDLLLREALKADQRMYDNFQAFAKALRAAVGGEPKLSALEVSENTGGALVRQDDGRTRSFSFVEGKLTEPSGNPLRDEAPPDQQLSGRFTFGDIDLNKVRAALKAQRAKPGPHRRHGARAMGPIPGRRRALDRRHPGRFDGDRRPRPCLL